MPIYRVYSVNSKGEIERQDFENLAAMQQLYVQTGVEEDSYTMRLHGEPIFKGLIGPMSEGKRAVRYETKQAFILLTEQWAKERRNGRRGVSSKDD